MGGKSCCHGYDMRCCLLGSLVFWPWKGCGLLRMKGELPLASLRFLIGHGDINVYLPVAF